MKKQVTRASTDQDQASAKLQSSRSSLISLRQKPLMGTMVDTPFSPRCKIKKKHITYDSFLGESPVRYLKFVTTCHNHKIRQKFTHPGVKICTVETRRSDGIQAHPPAMREICGHFSKAALSTDQPCDQTSFTMTLTTIIKHE